MEKYTRKAIFDNLKNYDVTENDSAFIEVTQWKNYEGFDVEIHSNSDIRFQLTFSQFDALKKLIKKLKL